MLLLLAGSVAIIIGVAGSSFGSVWSPATYDFLFQFKMVEVTDSFMPYFPLVPFYPLFVMMFGAFLIAKSRA